MPDWNLQSTWETAYRIRGGRPNKVDSVLPTGAGFGEVLTYGDGRKFAIQLSDDGQPGLSHYRFTLNKLGAVPAFTPATNVLVVGCGFGWLVEVMMDAGSNSAWGTDISTYIHSLLSNPDMNVPQVVQDRVLNVDITDPTAKAQFIAAGAGTNKGEFNWLVTELVVESFDPVSDPVAFTAFLDALDNLRAPGQGGVAHYVADELPSTVGRHNESLGMTWLTLAEWVAYRPAHWWVSAHTGEILGGQ